MANAKLTVSMTAIVALLSDRFRPLVLPVLGLVLIASWLGYGRIVDARAVAWSEVAPAPERFVGKTVVVSFGEVVDMARGGFVLRDEGREMEVRGSLPDLAVGRIVSVAGPLDANGRLELQEGHVHGLRRLKWLSGVVALLVVGALLLRDLSRMWRGRDA